MERRSRGFTAQHHCTASLHCITELRTESDPTEVACWAQLASPFVRAVHQPTLTLPSHSHSHPKPSSHEAFSMAKAWHQTCLWVFDVKTFMYCKVLRVFVVRPIHHAVPKLPMLAIDLPFPSSHINISLLLPSAHQGGRPPSLSNLPPLSTNAMMYHTGWQRLMRACTVRFGVLGVRRGS